MDSAHFAGALATAPSGQWLSSHPSLSGEHNAICPSVHSRKFNRLLMLQLRKHVDTTSLLIPLSSKLSAKPGSLLFGNCYLLPKLARTGSSASQVATVTVRKLRGKRGVGKRVFQVQCQSEHGAKNGIIYSNGAVYERLEIEDVHTPKVTVPLVEEQRRESVYLPNSLSIKGVNPLSIKGIDELCKDGECSIHEKVASNEPYFGNNLIQEDRDDAIEKEAWKLLRSAVITYCGNPVGTIAANDPTDPNPLNYDQVFIRDFVPSALAFLLKGETDIVRNFLLHTLQLQSWEKTVDCHSPGQGLMPASFKVRSVPVVGDNFGATEETLEPDFGEAAIGRVAPVDSGLWWIILLRAYGKFTGDFSLQERVDVQTGMKMILKLCLTDGFDMFPTLLVTDGSCMIDRRMGIHGHPLEIQALFYSSLRCAREMLTPEDGAQDLIRAVNSRLSALSFHIREYYWVDMRKLNEIYRYKTEEYSFDAVNKFNIYPEQIPHWLVDWIPDQGGYLIGNLQPAHMDFRFFSLGNLWSIVGSLATNEQAEGILDLVEARWSSLVGNMPFKICFPALEGEEWRIITGSDPKNTPWSYHNGGSWPALIWQFTAACIKMGRLELAKKALNIAEKRLSKDRWPEYYDTHKGRFIGKQARLYQTWTIAGYLVAKMMLSKPETARILTCEEDIALLQAMSCSLDQNPHRKHSRMASHYLFV